MVAMMFLLALHQGVHVSQAPDPTATQLALHPVQTPVLRRQIMSSQS
jgi:hypothetical protein